MPRTLENVDSRTIRVGSQLNVSNRQQLKDRVLNMVDAGERRFVIDFTDTTYVDSSGLGVLVSLVKKVRESGGELELHGMNEDILTLFELTRLDTLFTIVNH